MKFIYKCNNYYGTEIVFSLDENKDSVDIFEKINMLEILLMIKALPGILCC